MSLPTVSNEEEKTSNAIPNAGLFSKLYPTNPAAIKKKIMNAEIRNDDCIPIKIYSAVINKLQVENVMAWSHFSKNFVVMPKYFP